MDRLIISVLFLVAIAASPSFAMKRINTPKDQTNNQKTITFKLDDGKTITCNRDRILHSVTIKNMIAELKWQEGGELPLHNVNLEVFKHIIACLEFIHESNESLNELNSYVSALNPEQVKDLLGASQYLDIQSLVQALDQEKIVTSDKVHLKHEEIPSLFNACAQQVAKFCQRSSDGISLRPIPIHVSKYCASLMAPDVKAYFLSKVIIPTKIIKSNFKQNPVSLHFSLDGKILCIKTIEIGCTHEDDDSDGYCDACRVCEIKFNPDGSFLFIQTEDGKINIYDLKSLSIFDLSSKCQHFALNHDGSTLASALGGGKIKLYDLNQFNLVKHTLDIELTIEQVQFLANVKEDVEKDSRINISSDETKSTIYKSLPDIIKNIIQPFTL